jgi:4-carboxymuconolactone decarboxylase
MCYTSVQHGYRDVQSAAMSDSAPRLEPLAPECWDDDAVAALRGAFPDELVERFRTTGSAPNVLATMLHHPALAGPLNIYGNVLLQQPAIGHRARELMLLRVAWRTRARYEWVHHVLLASRYGISPEDIDAIINGVDAPPWTSIEQDLVAAADQLLDHYRIDDDTWERLAEHFDERQLVEIPLIVGTYVCLAMAFNSWGLQVEAAVDISGIPLPPVSKRSQRAV